MFGEKHEFTISDIAYFESYENYKIPETHRAASYMMRFVGSHYMKDGVKYKIKVSIDTNERNQLFYVYTKEKVQ